MANWLQKIASSVSGQPKNRNLPVVRRGQFFPVSKSSANSPQTLPSASIIYGVGSSALFVFGLYFVLTGHWITGALIWVLAACFLGFALQFMKH